MCFAREGAKGIVVNDVGVGIQEDRPKSPESAEETVRLIKELGCDAVAVFGDCSKMEIGEEMVGTAVKRWGDLDILVNNAGNLRDRMIFNMTEEEWDSVIRVHLKGAFTATRFACEYWRQQAKAGSDSPRRIINTSSAAGLFGSAGQPNYAAAKAGIVGFTLALAHSMARYGVTANAIAPGAETDPTVPIHGMSQALRDAITPEQVSPLVAYLATDAAGHINGRTFHVAGGRIDHVTHHSLVRGTMKRVEPWTVEELTAVFHSGFPGENPQPVQTFMEELADDIVSANPSGVGTSGS